MANYAETVRMDDNSFRQRVGMKFEELYRMPVAHYLLDSQRYMLAIRGHAEERRLAREKMEEFKERIASARRAAEVW